MARNLPAAHTLGREPVVGFSIVRLRILVGGLAVLGVALSLRFTGAPVT